MRQEGKHFDAYNDWSAVDVKDGILRIKLIGRKDNLKTGMITTEYSFGGSYGTYECRARLSPVSGTWVDAWFFDHTMCENMNESWDINTRGMEIDWWEGRSRDKNNKDISEGVQFTLHWDGYDKNYKSLAKYAGNNLNDGKFHIFKLVRTPKENIFYIDSKEEWRSGPSTSKELFLIFSCEVMDKFWAGDIENRIYNDVVMEIDYFRYFQD